MRDVGARRQFEGIQIARDLAALSVCYGHSWTILDRFPKGTAHPIPFLSDQGWIGVDVFFAISGFVICLVSMVARKPQSIVDLAWQAEAISLGEVESEVFDPGQTAVLAKLIEHFRALSGPLTAPFAPLTVLAGNRDAEIIEAGRKFEDLLGQFMSAWFEWAKRIRTAHNETEDEFGKTFEGPSWKRTWEGNSNEEGPAFAYLHEAVERHGVRAADRAMDQIRDEMERLAHLIQNYEIKTLAGLRAKALVAIWGMRPIQACHDGFLNYENSDDLWSLVQGTVAVSGLSDYYEAFADRV